MISAAGIKDQELAIIAERADINHPSIARSRIGPPGGRRLLLLVALLEILEFGWREGGRGRSHGDLTRIGFGIGDEFGNGLDPKGWVDDAFAALARSSV
jgi:hypothetical protein